MLALYLPATGRTQTLPDPPVILTPPENAVIQFPGAGQMIFFSWAPVEGATSYRINVAVNNFPSAMETTSETEIYLDLSLKPTHIDAAVSWSVLSVSGTEASDPAFSKFTFGIEGTPAPTPTPTPTPTPLPAPAMFIPEDGEAFSALDQIVLFDWSDVPSAYAYQLTVYKNNEVFLNRVVLESTRLEQFQQQIFTVFQWDVQTVDETGNPGQKSLRRSFSIGEDYLPTPTPYPTSPDIDQNGILNAADLYQFAKRFATNDPKTDFDHSGLINHNDVLRFLEDFIAGKQ
ncbi:MAG: GC-type dockerin domain-anchored protein [Candidatus Hinthialibacter sp.]